VYWFILKSLQNQVFTVYESQLVKTTFDAKRNTLLNYILQNKLLFTKQVKSKSLCTRRQKKTIIPVLYEEISNDYFNVMLNGKTNRIQVGRGGNRGKS